MRVTLLLNGTNLYVRFNTFMSEKREDVSELSDPAWLQDLVSHTDIFSPFNEFNVRLQGKTQPVTELSDQIRALHLKLRLWLTQLARGETQAFSCLHGSISSSVSTNT